MNSRGIARDARDITPDTEVCAIRVNHPGVTPASCRFEVVIQGRTPTVPLSVSSSFGALWYGGTLVETRSARAKFDAVVRMLAEAGWEGLDAGEGGWCHRRFRRRSQEHQEFAGGRTDRGAVDPSHRSGETIEPSRDPVAAGTLGMA